MRFAQKCGGERAELGRSAPLPGVAREGSIGAAAKSLKVNQSTTQRRLLALEQSHWVVCWWNAMRRAISFNAARARFW